MILDRPTNSASAKPAEVSPPESARHGGSPVASPFLTPNTPDVPEALANYAAEGVLLGDAVSGKRGGLDLTFARIAGRTRLVRAFGRVPYAVPRALYADPAWPDLAVVYLAMPTGGIVQGDRIGLRVYAANGTAAHLTTQSASRIYQMTHNCAVQSTEIVLDDAAYVEFWPDAVIPYLGARFSQHTTLRLAPTATLLYRDILTAGRLARGERFAFQAYHSRTTGTALDGKPLFVDALRLEPGRMPLAGTGFFGGYDVLGTLYVLTPNAARDDLIGSLDTLLRDDGTVFGGVSTLPNHAGVIVRVLGPSAAAVARTLESARATARAILGRPTASVLRK